MLSSSAVLAGNEGRLAFTGTAIPIRNTIKGSLYPLEGFGLCDPHCRCIPAKLVKDGHSDNPRIKGPDAPCR